jgi:hypothetical protein
MKACVRFYPHPDGNFLNIYNKVFEKYILFFTHISEYCNGQTGPGAHQSSYPNGTGALSAGVKRSGHEADHSSPNYCRYQEYMDLYIHSPIRLYGVVLNYLSTGKTLPYRLEIKILR